LKAGLTLLGRSGFFVFRNDTSLIELNLSAQMAVTIHKAFKEKEIKIQRLATTLADALSSPVMKKKKAEL
jgi:hypothetical protein